MRGLRSTLTLHAALAFSFSTAVCFAQQSTAALPDAPASRLLAQAATPPANPAQNDSQTPSPLPTLTLTQAEQMALAHNPNVSIAHLLELAARQVTREARAAELPFAEGNLTAVDAHHDSRLTAGVLNNPIVYNRAAGGLTVSQLLTDFGRTHHLILNAKSNAQAQLESERATTDDIRLAVDQAFYQALTAQAVLKVAQQTVATRQATGEQINALTTQKLRSTLDLSLANVQVSQARLMLLDAQSRIDEAMASLNALLGSEQDRQYELVDDMSVASETPPTDPEALVQLAFQARPDLAAENDRLTAARQFSAAEHDLYRPTISALAAAGGAPVRSDQILSSWYGAAGANVSIPLFNGFAFNARAHEADLHAQAAAEQVRNLREGIARDVRTATLDAQTAFQRIGVSQELLNQANTALELAQARYKVGLSGIADLTQAQLAQTEAQIDFTNARYAYRIALAVVRYQTGQ